MSQIGLLRQLARAKRNAKLSGEKIEKLQNKKLRRLLHHAYHNSKYYYEAFRSVGITEEMIDTTPLSVFPTIDKRILLDRFNDIITVPELTQSALQEFDEAIGADRKPYKNEYHVVHSSGSTGKPGYFIYDNKAWNAKLIGIIRAALWDLSLPQIIKLLAGKPHILYIAAADGHYGGAMAVGDGIDGVGAEQLHLDIKTPLSEWVKKIKDFQPDIVIGYPSAIKILGELTRTGEVQTNISRIISCGEPLGIHMRQYFEETFTKAVVLNFYGASESLALGVEENNEDDMILFRL
ncbi:MAG: phenylacetate--CoA ligase family protein [Lachnospiraceae bacterium]|nr:phenylacetate--CoA ligase family protein [Lachnospiraceae bacterium]